MADAGPLEPLALRHRRRLDLRAPTQPGRPHYLAAASSLVAAGAHLLVVADDETHLGVFAAGGGAPGTTVALLPEALPLDPRERKAAKPDFEGLAYLPAELSGSVGGAVLAVGSGSAPSRCRAVLLHLDPAGAPSGAPAAADLTPLYVALAARIPDLNIEGAAQLGNALYLAQRGNGPAGVDALIALDAASVVGAAIAGRPIGAESLRGIVAVDLGVLDGVRLTLTDLSPLPDRCLAFSAAAEASASTYDDGAVTGSAVGVIEPDGRVRQLRRVGPGKIEGIHATPAAGGLELLLVTDADDPTRAATLLAAYLPLR